MKTSQCAYCANPFRARGHKRFCSDRCRFRGWADGLTQEAIPCIYCGVPAETIDHIPPRAYREQVRIAGLSARYPEIEVDACRECNCLLGARALWTVAVRKQFIKRSLRRRYRKYLLIPDWSKDDLIEYQGARLTVYIETGMIIRDITKKRIAW